MTNMYDPTSPLRDRKMTDEQMRPRSVERPESVVVRKERARNAKSKDEFDKVMARKDKKTKSKTAEEVATQAKDKKTSLWNLPEEPQAQGYIASSHEQMLRQQMDKQEEETDVYVSGHQASQFHSPSSETAQQPTIAPIEAKTAPLPIKDIQQLVDQIVNKLYILKENGQSDTVITLRHPPILEGTTLKLTGFEHARKEFNITFAGLTQIAKEVVDANRESLAQALQGRGFTVHIITATTIEEPTYAEGETAEGKDDDTADKQQQKEHREEGKE